MHEAMAIIPQINKHHPGQFVSDKQCLATLDPPFGSANSVSFDGSWRGMKGCAALRYTEDGAD